MSLLIEFDLANLSYGVEDGHITVPTPGGDPIRVKVKLVTFKDEESGVACRVRLPTEPPPDGTQVPEDFQPPAKVIGKALLDNRPHIETATMMPSGPPPNGPPPRR